jgi:hypothetical protein
MNAKEKATELVDKYKPLCGGYWGGKINKEFAKNCALIAVDEIINSRPAITDSQIDYNKYWNDVKSELQSL